VAGISLSSSFGIRSVRVVASSARVVVQDCLEAEGSPDARDKLFMHAGAFLASRFGAQAT
jgi:hypothetical protein